MSHFTTTSDTCVTSDDTPIRCKLTYTEGTQPPRLVLPARGVGEHMQKPPAHWTTTTKVAVVQCETKKRPAARLRFYSVANMDETELAFWVHPFIKQKFCSFYNALRQHKEKFMKYTRMSITSFDELLEMIRPRITEQNTRLRLCTRTEKNY
ncbi:hypothetical protein PR048_031432 [Dryococelus australis]|uniref:Uncharacterized protein n=1 Tax=Dryococelus australis TaxID=614101 RepID=A0ABQ9G9B2_9NEOP|nr:hypothetical protein PR048_031432 [Dryococelus australis]